MMVVAVVTPMTVLVSISVSVSIVVSFVTGALLAVVLLGC
jgi:hypothetical protein